MKKTNMLIVALLALLTGISAQPATGYIKGKVTTADNKPAEGVTILIKNTVKNAVADNNGNFEIKNIQPGNYTLAVSLVGYKDEEQEVTVENGKATTVSFQLALSNRELNEVVVIANRNSFKTNRTSNSLRLQSPILEVPQNIQVVTAKQISNQQIFDMLEGVTRNVSGASRVEHWDNYARITMRGSNVGAFRNGMNVSTAWGPLTEDMSMVERIEFVKGPAGFMLANGDPSGFYNVVTKKPSGRNKGEVGISMGSFDLYRANLDLDGKFSEDGKLLYRINVMGQLKGSHRQFDFNNRYSVVPVLKYLIDDKTSVTLEYTHQFSEVNVIGSNYIFSKKGYADLPRDFTTAEANLEPTKMNDKSLLVILDHKLSNNWKMTAQAAYFNYRQVGASLWPQWPVAFDPQNDGILYRGMSIWDVLGTSKIGQMFVNGEVQTGAVSHKILAGLDMSNKEYYHDWNQGGALGDELNIYDPLYGYATPPVFDRSKNIRERGVRYYDAYTGLYVQDELGFLSDALRLTLAGRYTTLKNGDVYSGDFKSSRFTPRIGLSYSIDKNTAVYFVKDESFLENFGSDWQGKSFDPITGGNIEAGIKKDWVNGKWNSAVSVYQITRNNVQTADFEHPHPAGGFYTRQSGQQKTKGVEVDIRGQIVRGLDVIINYAYTEAKVTKDSEKDAIGRQVAGSSRHIQNAWLNYKMDRGALTGFGISVGYQYQVKRSPWYVFDNSENSLPDYFRLDGSLSYQKEKIGFNLVVNNILNKYLYSGAPYEDYFYWQTEPGTNMRVSVSYRF
ncbi:TonB-dependent receptor [Agriterribacter sp.]|uniref:TonB-dependent receptor n=1 Tax=Agriterribacter sp. TaxID=2821509 RepID=UPI002D168D14|nr:TonB-dependent receptor [Agriterribacter sp.]HRO48441.1 TonB-dependent receptor [Agriterribacter sp.]HRQ19518.1 TonB-dependent receptor [Agriterribacter sp.]